MSKLVYLIATLTYQVFLNQDTHHALYLA